MEGDPTPSICHYQLRNDTRTLTRLPLVCVPLLRRSPLPPSFTTSLVPAAAFACALPSAHPPSLLRRQVGAQRCVGPHHFRAPPFTHPLCTDRPTCVATPLRPPSPCAHPVSVPPPSSRKPGRKGGSAHPPPACAVPHPALPPALPRPASPSPLRACRGRRRDSAPPPSFPFAGSSPLYPGCTPPRLHVLHPLCTHAGGRADRASPLPFRSRARPSAPAAPPPLVRMRGEGQEGQCAPPPSVRPSAQASPSLPPGL